ncbi:MAG: ACT domain-containing protein [Gammaproteobacteria bacterium]|nr:ACT domain-containing protein [Gammaproteobacteria bacterium]
MNAAYTIHLHPETYAVCSLPADLPVPYWAWQGEFISITRAAGFYSLVCPAKAVPEEQVAERGWRLLHIDCAQGFAEAGLMARLSAPLAAAGISLYGLSAFDSDYALVKEARLDDALALLAEAGFRLHAAHSAR